MALGIFRLSSTKIKLDSGRGPTRPQVFQLNFILADQKERLRKMKAEGLLGLGPVKGDSNAAHSFKKGVPMNPIFAQKDSGIENVEHAIFTLDIRSTTKDKTMDVGGWSFKQVMYSQHRNNKTADGLYWFNTISNAHWIAKTFKIKVDDEVADERKSAAIIDSGSSKILLPSKAFELFKEQVMSKNNCKNTDAATEPFMCLCRPN